MTRYGFHIFRWVDFLTFGLATILSIGLSGWASLTPGNPIAGIVIAWLASAGFSFVYAMILARRMVFAREIAYTTNHGLVVMKSEWTPFRVHVEKETDRVMHLWSVAIDKYLSEQDKQTKSGRGIVIVRKAISGVILRWAKAPFTMHLRPAFKWMGLTSGSGNSMMVGRVDPLQNSALGHEIGHVILMHWRGDGSEEMLEAMSKKYNTPY